MSDCNAIDWPEDQPQYMYIGGQKVKNKQGQPLIVNQKRWTQLLPFSDRLERYYIYRFPVLCDFCVKSVTIVYEEDLSGIEYCYNCSLTYGLNKPF